MSSNPLKDKIIKIQADYQTLLLKLLPSLKSGKSFAALDEINLFWIRHMSTVKLYIQSMVSGQNCFVFTASTFLDFDDGEHYPFLLLGENHILDDPLCAYSIICSKIPENNNLEILYHQIIRTAEDNIKIIENCNNEILVFPLRLLSQSKKYSFLYEFGEQAFLSLFVGLKSLEDYFQKCNSIEDIIVYARDDIGNLILFSEDDNTSFSLQERFRLALGGLKYMLDLTQSDAYNFFVLVYGPIQQAVDVIASCLAYECIPFIRYPVALNYISLLSESIKSIDHIPEMRYKMCIAFILYNLCEKSLFQQVDISDFILRRDSFQFDKKVFDLLDSNGINEQTFLNYPVRDLILKILSDFYETFPET